MHLRDLDGKKICILGFGKEGQAMLKALEEFAPNSAITIADSRTDLPTTQHTLHVGPWYLQGLEQFEVIIKSPGIPPAPEIEAVKDKVTSGTQIFLDSLIGTGALVIGVTGSKGKSTTSTLIYEMLKAAGKTVYLIGNIGTPAISHIAFAKQGAVFVVEMSSYQLQDLTVSPQIAVVTSFFPEHLDYHGSLKAYKEAKKHIAQFQSREDVMFYGIDSPETESIAKVSPGTHVPFSANDCPVTLEETRLLGRHNLSNMAGAYKVATHLGVPHETCVEVLRAFRGLPHRLQSVGLHHGIEWVDDAISTTPESTIAALDALGDRVQTLILGGQDRGYRFAGLAKRVVASGVRTVILFSGSASPGTEGASGPRIRRSLMTALKSAGSDRQLALYTAEDMPTAVTLARNHTAPGAICLLSTASPSYGMFRNFEEKGEQFQAYVKQE